MDAYLWKVLKTLGLLLIFSILLLLPSGYAIGATNYRVQGELPKYPDSDFKEEEQTRALATVKITASTKDAFTAAGESYWAEFRLPRNFYITSAGIYGQGQQMDVELARGKGFEDQKRKVEINPIAEDRNNPGHYRGFEIVVENIKYPDDYPELVLYFNRVVVPRGFKGNAELSIDSAGAGFSSGTITIANILSARLTVEASEVQFIVSREQVLGPIKVTENMSGTFEYLKMTLPGGYQWIKEKCYIDPMLGFRVDHNGDGRYDENDFLISVEVDKYGQSTLRIETMFRTTTIGKMEIECPVQLTDRQSSYGELNLQLNSNAELNVSSLKAGSYSQQKTDLSVQNSREAYGGLCAQKIGNIIISENAPETMVRNRYITLTLPKGAKWAKLPSVKLEGDNYLDIGPLLLNSEKDQISFEIEDCSRERPGKIILEEGKVDLATDFRGDLAVEVTGSAGASGAIIVARVKPAFTVSSSKPALVIGKQEQSAGELEISESAGRVFLARELWIDFPSAIKLVRSPKVEITAGDMILSRTVLKQEGDRERLVIPIQNSSSSAAKLLIKDIVYNLNNMLPDGDLQIKLGGPAVNEVNAGPNPIFPSHDWVCEVANASISKEIIQPAKKDALSPIPVAGSIIFKIGEKTYQVNGQATPMDVEPYILEGRTFVPIRYAALAAGINPDDIHWDQTAARVTIHSRDNIIIQLKIGDQVIYRNGNEISMDTAAHIKDGRTMVPLRALAEALGRTVKWDAASSSVSIELPGT
ncbi:copper amine oxidase N-terminal domain-containing protein [Syntrophomonas wolfei]|uniref:Copper amine oxidase-like N-terminal domain-containing protein n=1 Tax=Syntrophomonas wolfei subsp. wolfei (strain DSM 2245B / Goettingen) TaxID=335541 RepID=Q0B0L0_SYNWW|nr:copper amine oxidase N-terminal domain-containing protein [Syntrophomonas wolfei]ABI67494.1 hypothetical protein Swol_0139 [Syntrophomonas wolfei subsp. wolfei str. Goettingen G311]